MSTPPLAVYSRGATFSPCQAYRYRLWRRWGGPRPSLVVLLLNPSTADAERNDPTVERCQRRAAALGFGGLEVVNLFALRSTNPRGLLEIVDPVGPDNDAAILAACHGAGAVLAGWGTHGSLHSRDMHVHALLAFAGVHLQCLGANRDGSPVHPLYQRASAPMRPYGGPSP